MQGEFHRLMENLLHFCKYSIKHGSRTMKNHVSAIWVINCNIKQRRESFANKMCHTSKQTVPIPLTNTHPGQSVRHFCRCPLLETGSFLSALLTHNSTAIKDNGNHQMSDADVGDQPQTDLSQWCHYKPQTRTDYLINKWCRETIFSFPLTQEDRVTRTWTPLTKA